MPQVEWQVETCGRQVGHREFLDEKQEPKLDGWIKAGVVKPVGRGRMSKVEDGDADES